MRVWYQLFIFDVSGIGLANKIIQIAKLALGISEQNFQKTAIVNCWIRSRAQKTTILLKISAGFYFEEIVACDQFKTDSTKII